MRHRQISAAFLAACMLLPALTACAEEIEPENPADTSGGVTEAAPEETTAAQEKLVLAMTDFEGAKLRILGMSEKYGFGYYETDDIWVESTNGEQFNDAIFDRNLACTDKYNF